MDKEIAHLDERDVNGKLAHPPVINVHFPLQKVSSLMFIELTLDQSKTVRDVQITLPYDPAISSLEKDYDKSGLYDAAVIALGTSCETTSNRLSLYRFFENAVKPKIRHASRDRGFNMGEAHNEQTERAPAIALCGHKMQYENTWGISTGAVSIDNSTGSFSLTNLTFN